jgi:hypothetical protein
MPMSAGRHNPTRSRWTSSSHSNYHKISKLQAAKLSRHLLKLMITLVGLLLIIAYVVWPSQRLPITSPPTVLTEDHHIEKSMLVMTLNRSQSTEPAVRVTVTNYHSSTTVSLLNWNTPFDEQAVAQGVFSIWDHDTGIEIKAPDIAIDRILAPKKDDFLELLPRHAVAKDVPVKATGITFKPGKNYDVKVSGRWKAVWHADAKVAGEQRLRLMGGPTGLVNWDYESNVFLLHVW